MKSILDPTFKYVPAASTDVRKTFARVRKRLQEEAKQREESDRKVMPIKSRASTSS